MEFNEKLAELRKTKGLTQEELSAILYVSRTAVSKWESGRGYPSIDSLKAISSFFNVSIDDLLSKNELLTLAQNDTTARERRFRDLVFGLLDLSLLVFLFIPIFAERHSGEVFERSLLSLTITPIYLIAVYYALIFSVATIGLLTLLFKNSEFDIWNRYKYKLSLSFSSFLILIFTISLQPYAAVLTFIYLLIKFLMIMKIK